MNKESRVYIRISNHEKELLRALAEVKGKTSSAVVRELLTHELEKSPLSILSNSQGNNDKSN